MAKTTIESCPSCHGSHSNVKLYRVRESAVSDGYAFCPVTKEPVSVFNDTERALAHRKFCEMVRSDRWLMATSISRCGDRTDVEHPIESWRMTFNYPKGDIAQFIDFTLNHIATISAMPVSEKLEPAILSINSPLDHLTNPNEETDAAISEASPETVMASVVSDDAPNAEGSKPTPSV